MIFNYLNFTFDRTIDREIDEKIADVRIDRQKKGIPKRRDEQERISKWKQKYALKYKHQLV